MIVTLPSLIAKSSPDTIDCRSLHGKPCAREGFETYWRVSQVMFARADCDNVWVVGMRNKARTEWHAGTSTTILRKLDVFLKLSGSGPDISLVLIEPRGTFLHRLNVSQFAAALSKVDLAIRFQDPAQQTIGF